MFLATSTHPITSNHIQSHPHLLGSRSGAPGWWKAMWKGALRRQRGVASWRLVSPLRIGNCGTPSKWPIFMAYIWGIEKPLTKWDDPRSRAHTGNVTIILGSMESMVSIPNVHQASFSRWKNAATNQLQNYWDILILDLSGEQLSGHFKYPNGDKKILTILIFGNMRAYLHV